MGGTLYLYTLLEEKEINEIKDKAETLIFDSFDELKKWIDENEGLILFKEENEETGVMDVWVKVGDKYYVATTKLKVDDFINDTMVEESFLESELGKIPELGEHYGWVHSSVIARELINLFEGLKQCSAKALGVMDVSPEEAEKLVKMASFVRRMAEELERSVKEGVKSYVGMVALGIIKDDRWDKFRKKEG